MILGKQQCGTIKLNLIATHRALNCAQKKPLESGFLRKAGKL
jgi:hypothetical protein